MDIYFQATKTLSLVIESKLFCPGPSLKALSPLLDGNQSPGSNMV